MADLSSPTGCTLAPRARRAIAGRAWQAQKPMRLSSISKLRPNTAPIPYSLQAARRWEPVETMRGIAFLTILAASLWIDWRLATALFGPAFGN